MRTPVKVQRTQFFDFSYRNASPLAQISVRTVHIFIPPESGVRIVQQYLKFREAGFSRLPEARS